MFCRMCSSGHSSSSASVVYVYLVDEPHGHGPFAIHDHLPETRTDSQADTHSYSKD